MLCGRKPKDASAPRHDPSQTARVMRAFNLPLAWGDRCTETLVLTTLYGPEGTRGEDPRVLQMLDEKPAITPKMTAEKYLTLLREVHGQWTISNPN